MSKLLRGALAGVDEYDSGLLISVFILCLFGTVMVFGAGSYHPRAVSGTLGNSHFLVHHLFRLAFGLVALVVCAHIDYRVLRKRYLNWGLFAVCLALVAIPAFMSGGINRWITLFGKFPVQPLEAAKIALVFFLAQRLTSVRNGTHVSKASLGRTLLCGPVVLAILLVMQPNYGNVLVTCVVTVILLFLARIPLVWLGSMLAPLAGLAVLAYYRVPKVQTRVSDWLAGIAGDGSVYQVKQSLIGMGAGGWFGQGPGSSHQRFAFLPESHTDFVFAVLGEEMGLLGTLLVIGVFMWFTLRGFAIAQRCGDAFGRIVGFGLTSLIFIYVVVNIAMVTGLLPVIGVPLPFVSYGGSALVTNLAAVGILLSIDRHGRSYRQWRSRWDRS